jgi:class 3 adenylate cyclase
MVIDRGARQNFDELIAKAVASLAPDLRFEVWDEERLCALLRSHFNVEVERIEPERLLDVRAAIDHAKGWHAFGGGAQDAYVHDPLKAQLLWNFGFWRLRQLRESTGCEVHDILKPGVYRNVAVLIADLCSFSSFVRDTPNADTMRESLIAFYSKARYEIINSGGMHYQFVGDQVIGFFGMPDQPDGFIDAAWRAARALCAIGKSVAQDWQRRIDRVQEKVGIHVGLSLGDLHLLPLRPFSRGHLGFIGDSINVAARLMSEASVDEIVATNGFFQLLDGKAQAEFEPSESVDAKNVGRIKAWRARVAPHGAGR